MGKSSAAGAAAPVSLSDAGSLTRSPHTDVAKSSRMTGFLLFPHFQVQAMSLYHSKGYEVESQLFPPFDGFSSALACRKPSGRCG